MIQGGGVRGLQEKHWLTFSGITKAFTPSTPAMQTTNPYWHLRYVTGALWRLQFLSLPNTFAHRSVLFSPPLFLITCWSSHLWQKLWKKGMPCFPQTSHRCASWLLNARDWDISSNAHLPLRNIRCFDETKYSFMSCFSKVLFLWWFHAQIQRQTSPHLTVMWVSHIHPLVPDRQSAAKSLFLRPGLLRCYNICQVPFQK